MSINTTPTTNFDQDAISLITEFEGFKPWVYIDTEEGVPTVGYGYALVVQGANGTWNPRPLDQINTHFTGTSNSLSAVDYAQLQLLANGLNSGVSVAQQETTLNTINANGYLSPTFSQDEAQTLLQNVIPEYTALIKSRFTTHLESSTQSQTLFHQLEGSREMAALTSLAYNSPSLIGKNLTTALQSGDRLAAWYEIRYASNAPKNGERSLGVDNRRAQEAATFGLFSNPDGPADAQEALRVISFLDSKQSKIDAYNNQLRHSDGDGHSDGDVLTDTEKAIREAEINDALSDAEAMLAAEGLQVASVSGDTAVITDTTSGAKIADVTIDTYFVEYKYTDHDYVETQTIFQNGATRTVFDDGIETGDYTSPEGIESSYLVTERGGSWVAFEGDNKQIYNNKDGSRIEAEFIGESVVVVTDLNTGQILDIVDQLAYESDRYFDWNNDEQYETSTPQPGQVGSGIGAEQQDGSVDFGEGAGIFSSSSGGADNVSGQQDALNTSNAAGDTSSSGTSTVQSKIDATIKLNIKDFTTVEQSGCFAADTPILMADGTRKRIADIATNDEVMSFDGLGELRKGRVKRTFEFADREVVELKGLRCPLAHRDEAA